jgi:hypothetical protein
MVNTLNLAAFSYTPLIYHWFIYGLLFDPQEFGVVHGDKMYQVANHHCRYEMNKEQETSKAQENAADYKSNNAPNSPPQEKYSNSTLIILGLILFMVIRHILFK